MFRVEHRAFTSCIDDGAPQGSGSRVQGPGFRVSGLGCTSGVDDGDAALLALLAEEGQEVAPRHQIQVRCHLGFRVLGLWGLATCRRS